MLLVVRFRMPPLVMNVNVKPVLFPETGGHGCAVPYSFSNQSWPKDLLHPYTPT